MCMMKEKTNHLIFFLNFLIRLILISQIADEYVCVCVGVSVCDRKRER